MRWSVAVLAVLLSTSCASTSVTSASAATPATATFVKAYANLLGSRQFDLAPEDVQTTADGGFVGLALTQSTSGVGVSWLLKLSASGATQWQNEVGCFSTPPGAYADGSSVVRTRDGGYAVGGGTIGCGSGANCPPSSGMQCALVEKLDSRGSIQWARVYGDAPSGIAKLSQTGDGGYIAVGSASDRNQNTGALILKLDAQGRVQWQKHLGPAGATQAYLSAVQQTSSGGYIATGDFYTAGAGVPKAGVLAVKLDSRGDIVWQRGFNSFDGTGAPTAAASGFAVIQSADGGYLLAGHWDDSKVPGECCSGALLLKLDAQGSIRWQAAYSSGVYCFFNGFSETCTNVGPVVYSVRQAADGGYILAGDENVKLSDSAPIEPWLAKVDGGGNLLWQRLYYQVNPRTERPLGENFGASALASDRGPFALGFTENVRSGTGELFGVKTDASGLAGASCRDVHPATPVSRIAPGFTAITPSLPLGARVSPSSGSPATAVATSVRVQSDC